MSLVVSFSHSVLLSAFDSLPRSKSIFSLLFAYFPPEYYSEYETCSYTEYGSFKTNHRQTILKAYPPKPLNCVLSSSRLPASSTMRSACLSLLLVTACWALPFRQSGFLDFMMEDEAGSGGDPSEPKYPDIPRMPEGPKCPFRCQCHLRVIQCSDLGKIRPLPLMVHMVVYNPTPSLDVCRILSSLFIQ